MEIQVTLATKLLMEYHDDNDYITGWQWNEIKKLLHTIQTSNTMLVMLQIIQFLQMQDVTFYYKYCFKL